MKNFLKLGLAAVAALTVFAGCAADADEEASSESDITTRGRPGFGEGAGVDELCGGIGGFECAAGLECVISEEFENVPDAAGHCERPKAQEGDVCGTGITGIPVVCAEGLECKGAGPADQMGTCQKPLGGNGDSCGRGLPACAPTFVCVVEPDDRGGRCEPTAFGGE